MERVERVYSTHATSTKELDCKTVNTTVHTFLVAEFTVIISGHSAAFESNKLFKEQLAFGPPQQERIILETVSIQMQWSEKNAYVGHIVPFGDILFINTILEMFLVEVF